MNSMEEVEAAEAKMNAAKEALLNYIEGRKSLDRDHHHRLVAQLKKAQADFLNAIQNWAIERMQTAAGIVKAVDVSLHQWHA